MDIGKVSGYSSIMVRLLESCRQISRTSLFLISLSSSVLISSIAGTVIRHEIVCAMCKSSSVFTQNRCALLRK